MSDREESASDADGSDGEASEWEYSLEDIEERERAAEAEAAAAASRREPLEAGDPSLEGVAFVLLGVAFTLFVFSRPLIG